MLYSKFVYSEEVRISFELSGITTEHSQPYKLRGKKKTCATSGFSAKKKTKNRKSLEMSTKQNRLKPEVRVSLKKKKKDQI